MNEEMTEKRLRQMEHILGHLWHRYSITVNQVMVVEIPKEHKIDLWLSRISCFVCVVGVYVGLPSELSRPNSFIKQSM